MSSIDSLMARFPRSHDDDAAWAPRLLDLSRADHRRELEALLAAGDALFKIDTVPEQLRELAETRDPSRKYSAAGLDREVARILDGRSPDEYGTWAYYPWAKRLVHVLPKEAHRELRADRNRLKITREEQARLGRATIGIVGVSVGNATALTLAMEGVGGAFRLADPDSVSLSNLNRLRAGVHEIGTNKAVLAAREMLELDPYLDIEVFTEGLTEENAHRFLGDERVLDILFEECDDLFMKIFVRERARELRIPVVMETNDRGLIDVERFDIEPQRSVFHGLIRDVDSETLKDLSTKDKIPFVLRIMGEGMSSRAVASLVEVEQTLTSWPQLGSGAALGGALATDVARRILLGELETSGRFYVDLETLVRDGAQAPIAGAEPDEDAVSAEALVVPQLRAPPAASDEVSADQIRSIVEHGMLAPSGGNCQPWRFLFEGDKLLCIHDLERSRSLLDFEHLATYLAFGAAVENMVLAAQGMGLAAAVRVFPQPEDPTTVAELTFHRPPARPAPPDLLEQIPLRVTNRKLGEREALDPQDEAALRAAAAIPGATLEVVTDEPGLEAMGEILGEGDRLRFLHETMHREMMAEVRWSVREVEETRDGLDIATLELSPADAAALRLLTSWRAMALVGKLGGGRSLVKLAKKAIAAASAVGLVTMEDNGPLGYFDGGRAMQRVWLAATARGLAFQPMTAITYLFARLERGGGEGLSRAEARVLADMRRRYLELLPNARGRADAVLFRIARAEPPSARSLRRPVDAVLEVR